MTHLSRAELEAPHDRARSGRNQMRKRKKRVLPIKSKHCPTCKVDAPFKAIGTLAICRRCKTLWQRTVPASERALKQA